MCTDLPYVLMDAAPDTHKELNNTKTKHFSAPTCEISKASHLVLELDLRYAKNKALLP